MQTRTITLRRWLLAAGGYRARLNLAAAATLALLALSAANSHAALIVRYSFDETDNTISPQIVDSVGPTFSNGDQSGGVDLNVDGVLGSGASFDGVNDFGRAGDSMSEFKTGGDFTFTTWLNLADETPDIQARVFDTTNVNDSLDPGMPGGEAGRQGWRLLLNNNVPGNQFKLQLQARGGGGPFLNTVFPSLRDVQSDGAWTFVAVRYDVDGDATVSVLYQTDPATPAVVSANSDSVAAVGAVTYGGGAVPRIASNQNGSGKYLAAVYDEITLWDTALTDQELATVFAEGRVPEPSSLLVVVAGMATLLSAGRVRGSRLD